jgi:hypothetical protein
VFIDPESLNRTIITCLAGLEGMESRYRNIGLKPDIISESFTVGLSRQIIVIIQN